MSLLVSIIALGLIITTHELGHFSFAKLFKVGVVEFSLGMGPVLFSKVKGETRYSLRLLPFGGSCMMLGEEDDELENREARNLGQLNNGTLQRAEASEEGDSIVIDGRSFPKDRQFYAKPAWERFLIIAAGPVFNFLLAFLFAVILTLNVGWDRPVIAEVTENSAAEAAGILPGDRITSLTVSGRRMGVNTSRDMALFFTVNDTEVASLSPVTVTYLRNGEKKEARVTPVFSEAEGRALLGITYSLAFQPLLKGAEVLPASFYNVIYIFRSTFESFRMLLTGKVGAGEVSGVVGVVAVMDESVTEARTEGTFQDALMTLLNIMIIISGSLGITNLLPLPALDGGRLVFILIEILTGKAVPKKIEGYIHGAGMVLLLTLMALIMANDIRKLFL